MPDLSFKPAAAIEQAAGNPFESNDTDEPLPPEDGQYVGAGLLHVPKNVRNIVLFADVRLAAWVIGDRCPCRSKEIRGREDAHEPIVVGHDEEPIVEELVPDRRERDGLVVCFVMLLYQESGVHAVPRYDLS
jgi:hypothetical protein